MKYLKEHVHTSLFAAILTGLALLSFSLVPRSYLTLILFSIFAGIGIFLGYKAFKEKQTSETITGVICIVINITLAILIVLMS